MDDDQPFILKKGTVDELFLELETLPLLERKNYLDDWIIHFASINPVFEENDEDIIAEDIIAHIFIQENPLETWSNLYIVGDSFGWDPPQLELQKIKNTSWYYTTISRPAGTCLHYLVSPNEQIATEQNRIEYSKSWRLDIRNVRTVDDTRIHSIMQFPGFVSYPSIAKKKTSFENLRLPRKLQGIRSGHIGVISQKNVAPKFLLVVHDSEASLKYMGIDKLLKHGVNSKRWPGIVVVGLNLNGNDQLSELISENSQYPRFFKNEILTTVEDFLNHQFEPEEIIVYGHSLGGWAAFNVVWNNPDIVKHAICQSTPWWWPDEDNQRLIEDVQNSRKQKIGRIYLDSGSYEAEYQQIRGIIESTKFMAQALHGKKYDFMVKQYLMAARYQSWQWAFPSALDYIITGEKNYQEPTGRELDFEDAEI
ncbi:MAG: alpha/beta hydrolase [Candidatus Kariarchaeaceae archaeon]